MTDTPHSKRKAVIAVVACVFFWGFSFISTKITVPVFPPMTLGALRFALAVVFLFFIKLRTGLSGERLHPRDLPWLIGSGLTGVTLYFFFENNGVAMVSASEASIITAAIPVLTMVTGRIVNKFRSVKETLGLRLWLGALVSVIGVVMVALFSPVLKKDPSSGYSGSVTGYFFMGGAALSWVAYAFLTQPLFRTGQDTDGNKSHSHIFIAFWQNFFGFLGFLPFAAMETSLWGTPTFSIWIHVAFLGIFCSALGYWLYVYSLKILGISVSSVFINIIPVITVIFGFLILGERLGILQLLGAVLVLGGLYLTVKVSGGEGN